MQENNVADTSETSMDVIIEVLHQSQLCQLSLSPSDVLMVE